MMTHNKRCRVCSRAGPDYVSDLHESLMVNILSRLPILDAIRTSTLSRTWKDKWTLTPFDSVYASDMSLVHRGPNGYLEIPDFNSTMTKILSLPLPHVKSFTIHCVGYYNGVDVQMWICSILQGYKNLENLELIYNSRFRPVISVPSEMMSLTTLRLYNSVVIAPPPRFNFPNLTHLELCGVDIRYQHGYEEEPCGKAVLMLPALKVCNLVHCFWHDAESLELHAPALTTFKSQGRVDERIREYSIKLLGAPKLALFEISDCLQDNFILSGSTVDCASLQLSLSENPDLTPDKEVFLYQEIPMIQELFNNQLPSSMNHLMLTSNVAEVIVQEHPLRQYDALKRLDISGCVNTGTAMELLHAMPGLKYLTMDANWYLDDGDDAMERVPFCLTYSLEEVMFKYYSVGSMHLFHLENFLFKKATQLKKVSISISHLLAKDENMTCSIVNQLSTSINYASSTSPTIIRREHDVLYVFMRASLSQRHS